MNTMKNNITLKRQVPPAVEAGPVSLCTTELVESNVSHVGTYLVVD